MSNKMIGTLLFLFIGGVLNLLFFLWTDAPRTDATLLSYGFTTFSYVCLMATVLSLPKNAATYTWTLPFVTAVYFIVDFLATVLLMLFTDNTSVALTVHVILLAFWLIVFLIHFMANRATRQAMHNKK